MRKAFDEDQLRSLIANNAVREAKVCRVPGTDSKWMLEVRLGGSGSHWIPVRSAREPVRAWLSPTAIFRFAEGVGLLSFVVEL